MTKPQHQRTPLGQIVRRARDAHGMTQAEYAEYIGQPRSALAFIETSPTPRIYAAIIEALARDPEIDRTELYAAADAIYASTGRIPPELVTAIIERPDVIQRLRRELL